MDSVEIIKILGTGISAGIVSSLLGPYITAKVSFRRFKQEYRWNETREAYYSIIQQISDIRADAVAEMTHQETRGTSPVSGAPKRGNPPSLDLRDVVSKGKLIVSAKTVAAVEEFWKKYDSVEYNSPYEKAEVDFVSAKKALSIVFSEAERVLGKAI